MLISTHYRKNLFMDFMTGIPVSTNWKSDSYNSILVIVNWLTKIVYYEPVNINIKALWLAKVTLDVVVWHSGLADSIVTNRSLLFNSKFWSLLCYLLSIKRRLSTTFHSQMDGKTKKENSTIEAYLQAFVNFEQND